MVKNIDNHADNRFSYPETAFDRIFPVASHNLMVKIYPVGGKNMVSSDLIAPMVSVIKSSSTSKCTISLSVSSNRLVLKIIPEGLLVYHVPMMQLVEVIQKELGTLMISSINYEQQVLPIYYGGSGSNIDGIIKTSYADNSVGEHIQLRQLVDLQRISSPHSLFADANGMYYPIRVNASSNDVDPIVKNLRKINKGSQLTLIGFSDDYLTSRKTASALVIVLLVSVFLLYFIMAAQFESLWQPLIVLVELPIDFDLALSMLWLFGGTINIMSLIGLEVMVGIIINDSILKIDTINKLLSNSYAVDKALRFAGVRRVKTIVMTSATTVLAMVLILFGSDMGSELQRPKAIVLLYGMFLGTLVSLFVVPLLYAEIYRFINRYTAE